MEFLRDLFGGGTLTYDQLTAAAREKGYQVVNAAGGAYVPKADADNLQSQVATLTGQLADANKKLEGYDPSWKDKAAQAQKQLEAQQFDFALEKAVAATHPRNARAVMALLDRDKLSFAGGEVIGLEKQLDAMQKSEDTAFLFEAPASQRATGLSHQNAQPVGGSGSNDAANQALRAVFAPGE